MSYFAREGNASTCRSSAHVVRGNATERPVRKKFEIGASAVCRNDRDLGRQFMELIELRDNLVRARSVVIRITQKQRLADAVFDAALVVNSVTNVKEAVPRIQVDEYA